VLESSARFESMSAGGIPSTHRLSYNEEQIQYGELLQTSVFVCSYYCQGGGERFEYPRFVWSPSGGWWCNPTHWKRNTALVTGAVLLSSIPVFYLSAGLEVSLVLNHYRQFMVYYQFLVHESHMERTATAAGSHQRAHLFAALRKARSGVCGAFVFHLYFFKASFRLLTLAGG
jgi:hypothetical protein